MTEASEDLGIEELAALVCSTLERHGVQVVLSGGSVVSIYSDNAYQSYDLDFIQTGLARMTNPAMEQLGFAKQGRHWVHPQTAFLVELPPGPVQVGDANITEFAERRTRLGVLRLLAPTDCVMGLLRSSAVVGLALALRFINLARPVWRLAVLAFLAVSLAPFPLSAQRANEPSPLDRRAVCKWNKARAHLPVLQADIQFKPNAAALKTALQNLNTDTFCDCTFDRLESAYGAEHVRDMGAYEYATKIPPAQLQAEDARTKGIYFECLGLQSDHPQLAPPTASEVHAAVSKPPSGLSPVDASNGKIFEKIQLAIQKYEADRKKRPRQLKELVAAGLLESGEIKDRWGRELFSKQMASGQIRLISFGPDGKYGTFDDIEE